MDVAALLLDGFSRVDEVVAEVLDDLPDDHLHRRVTPDANPIGWLIWHLFRVQDDHIADVADQPQRWVADGWQERFALPLPSHDTGYAHDRGQVDLLSTVTAPLLRGYAEAVSGSSRAYLAGLTAADLDRIVDTRWDPPVTLGVRLLSILSDDLQHAGQAAYVRGLLG
ncbi:MAG: DUF664 domain-containing protein [Actinomycetota bacterium]|nr:MAG: DUF664 domain-containing protein [Actinomycetota bacterium]